MNEEIKRRKIRRYFSKSFLSLNIILLLLGGIIIFISNQSRELGMNGVVAGGIIFLIGLFTLIVSIIHRLNRPNDNDIDTWFQDDLRVIIDRSLKKLGLDKEQIISDELTIISPIYWSTIGIPFKDVRHKRGKDNLIRFSIYRVTVIQLADQLLASYACDFNFMKNVKLNEETNEFHYVDIASVSTGETSSSYKLPNGKSMVHAQVFRLTAVSGEKIEVTIGSPKLSEELSGTFPETGAEKAVQVIRVMLREKKHRSS